MERLVSLPEPEREAKTTTVRVLLLQFPTEEEIEEDLAGGKVPELRVVLGVKSAKSRYEGRWTLFGGKQGEGESLGETAMRELREEANVCQIIGDYEKSDYQFSYRLPYPYEEGRDLRVFLWLAPHLDRAYPVDGEGAKIREVKRVALSQFLEMVEDGDERLLEYLREMGRWQGSALEHLREINRLFRWKIGEIVARASGDPKEVNRELVFWEAKEYLKRYVGDEYRFVFAFFSVMFAEGVSLWSRRKELLSLLEDTEAQERLNRFLGLLEEIGKDRDGWSWRRFKHELVRLGLWTGEISGLGLRRETDELIDSIVRVLQNYGSNLGNFGDVSVMNEARSYSLREMVRRMMRGRGRE
ncbi:MAG TPA: NUDIX hydrolase, partial [Thermoplasmata archaeon]|nr:NUDIX hydrolase [Thermoplasmata archaeon]